MYQVILCMLLSLCPQDESPQDSESGAGEAPLEPSQDGLHLADRAELLAFLPRLRDLMEAGIERSSPSAHFTRKLDHAPLFSGSYDYHSCVIAHWALLVMARLDGDTELEARTIGRLQGDALQRELRMLATLDHEKRATYPYDVAWLCMLLSELARHEAADQALVEQFRIEVEAQILDYLETHKLPERVPNAKHGGTEFNGFYRSWLFAYLLLAWSDPIGEGVAAGLATLRTERIEVLRPAIEAQSESFHWDFLWVPALIALIDRCAEPDAARTPYALRSSVGVRLPDSVSLASVHILGMHLCRLWPLAADGARDQEASMRAYLDGMGAYLVREDLWSADFKVVTHWVPQFIWIGVWLALDRP